MAVLYCGVGVEEKREFARSIEALEGLFGFIDEQLPAGVGERFALHVHLAVEEIFTNMVRHNQPGGEHISVAVEVSGDDLHVWLMDSDVEPFDPDAVPKADVALPMAERRPGGLGLHLVKSIVDRLAYEYQDRVMRVDFVKALGGSDV